MSDDEFKSGAEAIALLEKTKWGAEKKKRRIAKLAGAAKRGIGRYMTERKRKKDIYKKAYEKAETAAIISKARREARARHTPKPRGRGMGGGLFDLPAGLGSSTVFGEAPRRRPTKRRKPAKKKRAGRRRIKRVEYY